MSFAETFHDLRRRRRLPYTVWRPEIGPPYVSDVEKKGLLPSEEKLERLASVFVEVAREQGAPDPEEDARILFRERDRSYFIERANIEPDEAAALVSLRELVREVDLDQEEREKVLDTLKRTHEALEELPPDERERFIEALDRAIESFEGNGNHESSRETARSARSAR